MGTINRVPRGLLSFFDAKTGGRTPPDIDPRLQVGVDALLFYASDIPFENEIDLAAGVTTVGTFTSVEVPAGQLWLVFAIESRATKTGSPSPVGLAPVVLAPSPGGQSLTALKNDHVSELTTGVLGTGNEQISARSFETPWFAGSGTEFATQVTIAGTATTYQTSVLFKRLQV